jgi:nucleoside diphosphate kinase
MPLSSKFGYCWAITFLWVSLWACIPEANEVKASLNRAVVLIKPHAVNDRTAEFVRQRLEQHGIAITRQGLLTGHDIAKDRLCDRHYATIARYATQWNADQVILTDERAMAFEAKFGVPWSEAVRQGKVLNAAQAREALEASPEELQVTCDTSTKIKLAPGLYVARFEAADLFVLNGFYLANRAKFTREEARVRWFTVEWDEAALTWADFRAKVIGPTNPTEAPVESIRGAILARWQELGLASVPTVSDNGVHASAGPLEGIAERGVWMGMALEEDPTATAALAAGVSASALRAALDNPVVTLDGKTQPLFDTLEDRQTSDVIPLLVKYSEALEPQDTQYLFNVETSS